MGRMNPAVRGGILSAPPSPIVASRKATCRHYYGFDLGAHVSKYEAWKTAPMSESRIDPTNPLNAPRKTRGS